jgi:hypothetical protein
MSRPGQDLSDARGTPPTHDQILKQALDGVAGLTTSAEVAP